MSTDMNMHVTEPAARDHLRRSGYIVSPEMVADDHDEALAENADRDRIAVWATLRGDKQYRDWGFRHAPCCGTEPEAVAHDELLALEKQGRRKDSFEPLAAETGK